MSFRRFPTLAAVVFVLGSASLNGQEPVHIEGLGSLWFPNSGAEAAQTPFFRGVLLLHSFEYDDAAAAFREAQEADPSFAMAYWGEAMTYTHPVWNEKDPEAARAALNRLAPTAAARQAAAPTDREKAYLAAVDVLYGEGAKERLDTLYSAAMQTVHQRWPDDLEAQTFYALSLLGLSQGDRDVPTYMEAGALALDAFDHNPDHPGAAHYAIHSFDDPTHAILAMEAARAYGPIAPDAGHAQHMTTHIFLARGLWDDVVEANLRADAVVDRGLAARELPPTDCGHYNQWLMYGYQQQGRYTEAESLAMGCYRGSVDERVPQARRDNAAWSYALMRAMNLADTRSPDSDVASTVPNDEQLDVVSRLAVAWGTGVAALHAGDHGTAEASLGQIVHRDNVETSFVSPYAPIWEGTLRAMLLMAHGDRVAALEAAHGAAEYEASLPVDFGPPLSFKPARELEGEILLNMERTREAMVAFQAALARTPNRILSLAGYARAATGAGQEQVAAGAYARLQELLTRADAGMPEAEEASRARATETAGGR